jgi:hypothetical protein
MCSHDLQVSEPCNLSEDLEVENVTRCRMEQRFGPYLSSDDLSLFCTRPKGKPSLKTNMGLIEGKCKHLLTCPIHMSLPMQVEERCWIKVEAHCTLHDYKFTIYKPRWNESLVFIFWRKYNQLCFRLYYWFWSSALD